MTKSTFFRIFVLLFIVFTAACTPEDDFVESLCPPSTNSPVRITVDNIRVSEDPGVGEVQVQHQLYIDDLLRGMEPSGAPLTGDTLAIVNFFKALLDEAFDYEGAESDIDSTGNALDFMEDLITTIDPNKEIEEFTIARQIIVDAIARDDGVCFRQNNNIVINVGDGSDLEQLPYIVAFDYIPDPDPADPDTSAKASQLIIHNPVQEDLETLEGRQQSPFISRAEFDPATYTNAGYVQPLKLEIFYQKNEGLDQLVITDEPDLKNADPAFNLIDMAYLSIDRECEVDGEPGPCPDGTTTRTPQKDECIESETGIIEERTFSIGSLTGLKRARLEVDFDANETRLFVSNFVEAVEDPDDGSTIQDPTECEIRQILTEVNGTDNSALWDEPAVRVTDPNYDIDLENPPTPLAVFSGLPVTSRN